MRAVIQRVQNCSVEIEGKIHAHTAAGMLVLVGFEEADTEDDLHWLSQKILNLRIFNDANGVMNISVAEATGEIMLVSQFTLHASTKKGNRPSYIRAARPDTAIPLYEKFIALLSAGTPVKTGIFGADMKVSLVNDGPVTIVIDTKNRE